MKNHITGHASIIIDAPKEKVWEALTRPELIKQYFFGTDTHTDWKPGSPIRFTGEWQGKKYEDKGTVLSADTNRLLRYEYWSSMSGIEDLPENYVIVTYELEEKGEGVTELSITQENIPTEQMREHSEQNWNKVLEGLKAMLEKDKTAYGTFYL
ncbi:MAG: SRPBCC domain-containing protein [Chitinophagaceae bacterium]|nr:SRPBCC domain-containing protein [Chitinophagaceae bacterium]